VLRKPTPQPPPPPTRPDLRETGPDALAYHKRRQRAAAEALGYNDEKPEPPEQQEFEPSPVPHAPRLTHAPTARGGLDLSSIGPSLTDEERDYIAKSPERIGRMIADFAERQAATDRVVSEIRERFPAGPDTSSAGALGLDALAQLREGVVVDYRAVDIARAKRRLNADSMLRFTIASLMSRGLMRLRYLGGRADSRIG